MLGLPDDAVSDEPLWMNTGIEQLVIPLRSPELVEKAKPVPELLEKWGYSSDRKEAMAYVWARGQPHWSVRFFFTSNGAILEDPATGSACANLGGWHVVRKQPLPEPVTLRQGERVGRPSELGLRVQSDGAIFVSGQVIELGRGSLSL
jgi:trans-2,3-dihydro-3-hydroxyanthranilate isomerase